MNFYFFNDFLKRGAFFFGIHKTANTHSMRPNDGLHIHRLINQAVFMRKIRKLLPLDEIGFLVPGIPAIADKIDLLPNFEVITTLVLGWPSFKQEGIVAREFRPVSWLREGAEGPEIEE